MSLSETISGAGVKLNATAGYNAWVAVQKALKHLNNPELEKVLVKDIDPKKPWDSLTPEEKTSYNGVALYLALLKNTSDAVKAHKKSQNPEKIKKTSGFFLFSGVERVKAQKEGYSIPSASELGEMWRELSDSEKKEYSDRAVKEDIPTLEKVESVADERVQCSGMTKKNKQCSRMAVEDGLCKQHHGIAQKA
jgi:hypothetical protein